MDEVIILTISVVAGILTYIVSHVLNRGPVIASAIITLIAGLMLPYFFPETGGMLATAAACSSYSGMISLENALNPLEMAVISLMTGILFILAVNAYPGIGGRLGTIAAIACFSWLSFKEVFIGLDKKYKV